jgi:hypothetical protein
MVLVKKYSNSAAATSTNGSKPAKGIFAMAVKGHTETKKKTSFAGKDEVDMYLSGISPVEDGFDNPLGWWNVNCYLIFQFLFMSCFSKTKAPYRQLRALQETFWQSRGVSIAVEQLFRA